jgi:hypothetical protein
MHCDFQKTELRAVRYEICMAHLFSAAVLRNFKYNEYVIFVYYTI